MCVLLYPPPPGATSTYTLFPYSPLVRSTSRVDDDALGPQDRAHPSPGPHLLQERADDRRSGDDEVGADERGDPPVNLEHARGHDPEDEEGDRGAERAEQDGGAPGLLQLPSSQAEAALEEDERHRERHDREEEVAAPIGRAHV